MYWRRGRAHDRTKVGVVLFAVLCRYMGKVAKGMLIKQAEKGVKVG